MHCYTVPFLFFVLLPFSCFLVTLDTLRLIHKTPTLSPNVTFPQLRRGYAPHLPDSSRKSTGRFKKVSIFFFCCLLENGWGNPVETSCFATLTAGVMRKKYSKLRRLLQFTPVLITPPLPNLECSTKNCRSMNRRCHTLGATMRRCSFVERPSASGASSRAFAVRTANRTTCKSRKERRQHPATSPSARGSSITWLKSFGRILRLQSTSSSSTTSSHPTSSFPTWHPRKWNLLAQWENTGQEEQTVIWRTPKKWKRARVERSTFAVMAPCSRASGTTTRSSLLQATVTHTPVH